MGTSYANFAVRAEQKKVVAYLRYARRPAFVSPMECGSCVVCEPMDFDLSERAADLSKMLRCVVLNAMNNDDDYFMYELWHDGNLLDAHRSPGHLPHSAGGSAIVKPDEWTPESDKPGGGTVENWIDDEDSQEEPHPGDANVICKAFDRRNAVKRVAELLTSSSSEDPKYILSHHYHADLIEMLGLPPASLGCNYEQIRERPDDFAGWIEIV